MAAPAGLWRLRLLGAFELDDGVQRHAKLGTRAAMALLARLALRPGSDHPRETLIELLWPGVAADASRQRLRQTLSTLKQVLEAPGRGGGPVLDADRLAIRLVPGALLCDAVAFEQAARAGDHERAHTLYGGELLPGFHDEWIGDERLRLEGLFDRLRPPGIAPPRAADVPTAAAAPVMPVMPTGPQRPRLPAYLTRMVGADPQAARLQQEVAGHRLVTLLGPGGAGKTRLSVEVAQALSAQAAFDIVVFAPLAPCRSRPALLDQLLLSLQLTTGRGDPLESLVHALEGRHSLLVLDNFEQLVDEGAELVAELGARLPGLHQLVTSRRALALPGEREVTVATLALPAADAVLAEAARNPAVALFVDRARAARAEFHLHEGNQRAVVELVQLLDGMPLAIELAAARVRSMAPAEMVGMLRRARDRGAGAPGPDAGALGLLARAPQRGRQDSRHHSMQQAIDWSWQLLDSGQRELLAALTVFHGGFSAAAAAAVCAGPVALALDGLLSHSLLRATPAEDGSDSLRFSLYEPIREFAQRTLPPETAAALRRRHRAWAVAWGRAMPATPPLAALRTELPNLTAAMASAAADGEPASALHIVVALQAALDHVNLPSAGQAALEAALESCDDAALRCHGMVLLGLVWFRSGRGDDARRLLQQALAAVPADQHAVRARGLIHSIVVAWASGERGPLLLAWLDAARAAARAAGDALLLARVDGVCADIVGHRDRDFERADRLHADALAVWRAHGDELAVLRSRFSAAQVALSARRHAWVCGQMEALAADARRLQSWHLVAQCLNVRGAALVALRRWPEGSAEIGRSIQVAWLTLDSWNTALALWTLLIPLARAGQPAAAQQLAAFASAFWVQCFSPLPPSYRSQLRCVRRMARLQIGAAASAAAWADGEKLTAAQAVALALAASGA